MTFCAASVYGVHGVSNVRGHCLLCGEKIDRPARFGPDNRKRKQARRAQDPLSIDGPDEGDYWDGF
jgi:rRNA maturation protein Nop10